MARCVWPRLTKGTPCNHCGAPLPRDYPKAPIRQCGVEWEPVGAQGERWTQDNLEAMREAAGIDQAPWSAFISKEGAPPGCQERQCWWLKKFEAEFGAEAADRLRAELFGR